MRGAAGGGHVALLKSNGFAVDCGLIDEGQCDLTALAADLADMQLLQVGSYSSLSGATAPPWPAAETALVRATALRWSQQLGRCR